MEPETTDLSKLGQCEVCAKVLAKYRCPKCEIKTCCLTCVNIHKKELSCDGIRDRTKFIPLKQMTEMHFQSDYKFLEECTRYVGDRKVDRIKSYTRYNNKLPPNLMKLRSAAKQRQISLRFMVDNFTKRKENTSFHLQSEQLIYWRVEWIFPNAGNLKFVDDKCSEKELLSKLLEKYVDATCLESVPMKKSLEFYQSKGLGGLSVLLKAEGVKNCKNRFYELDVNRSLMENLKKKSIVEFPSIYVVFDDSAHNFEIIDDDSDIHLETVNYKKELDLIEKENKLKKLNQVEGVNDKLKDFSQSKKTDKVKSATKNFLFTDESALNDSSDSESDKETETIPSELIENNVNI